MGGNDRKASSAQRGFTQDNKSIQDLDVVHSGWVLKKKRKKMQGYAKRFLVLTTEGILTYALSPDKPTRDSIEIPHASVTSSQRHGTLHIDSGASMFHLKAMSPEDFNAWRTHLRSFIPDRPAGSLKRVFVSSGSDLQAVDLGHVFTHLDQTAALINDIAKRSAALKEKTSNSSAADAIMGAVGAKASTSEDMEAFHVTAENLIAEFEQLKEAIESKIPRSDPDENITSSGPKGGIKTNRMSMASFNSTENESAIFYDADSHGDGLLADDEPSSLSRSESSTSGYDSEADDSQADSDTSKTSVDSGKGSGIEYRTKLPAKVSGDEVSLFSMLKKNVGKDLSTISFPVSFNCPLSMLQAAAEEYEYASDLLTRAGKTEDWVDRICLVGAFAVSGYASTKLRASRKPFNPLLGETFECVREDQNLKFLAEKVVHQPPVIAFFAEGKGWKAQGWSVVKNKFWGKSLELIPEGSVRLEFADGDVFSFSKPSSFMRNLLAGNKYLEHVGDLVVTNENTGQRLVMEFKEGNMWGGSSSRNAIEGKAYDANDKQVTSLKGKWTESVSRQKDKENYQMLWEANEMPPYAEDYYGFTYFAMSLNEESEDCKDLLPPTDSRFRPDQRAFEEGNVDKAEQLKHKLEEAQRSRRKQMESDGKSHTAKWFHKGEGEPDWQYGGPDGEDYFKIRKQAAESGKDKAWSEASVQDVFEV